MENKSDKMLHDYEECIDSTSTNTNHPEIGVDKGVLKNFTRSSGDVAETKIAADGKSGENCPKSTRPEETDASGDVNMEASITPDDVIRAGGFGARDDISSFLPLQVILPTSKLQSEMHEIMKNHMVK